MATILNKDGNVTNGYCEAGCKYPVVPSESNEVDFLQDEYTKSINLFNVGIIEGVSVTNLSCTNGVITCSAYPVTVNGLTLKDFCPNLKVGDNVKTTIASTGTKTINLVNAELWFDDGTWHTVTQAMLDSSLGFYNNVGDGASATITQIQISKFDVAYQEYDGLPVHENEFSNNSFGNGTDISYGTNCNNLTRLGVYTTSSSTNINSMSNLPTGVDSDYDALRIEVKSFANNQPLQELYCYSADGIQKFIRYYDGSDWQSWEEVALGFKEGVATFTTDAFDTTTSNTLKKSGKNVVFNFEVSQSYYYNGESSITITIPEGFRPKESVSLIAYKTIQTGSQVTPSGSWGTVTLSTDGTMTFTALSTAYKFMSIECINCGWETD